MPHGCFIEGHGGLLPGLVQSFRRVVRRLAGDRLANDVTVRFDGHKRLDRHEAAGRGWTPLFQAGPEQREDPGGSAEPFLAIAYGLHGTANQNETTAVRGQKGKV